ncbi:unnamed protein product [Lepidochelys kempii]
MFVELNELLNASPERPEQAETERHCGAPVPGGATGPMLQGACQPRFVGNGHESSSCPGSCRLSGEAHIAA